MRWHCLCVAGLLSAAGQAQADWMLPPTAPSSPPAVSPSVSADKPDDLQLAAGCLRTGDQTAAVRHLGRYVADHPGQSAVRAQLAELLWKRDQLSEARGQFEQLLRHAPPGEADSTRLVHCHSRLMDIARRQDDGYGEHLHRGIALWLLATQPADDGDPPADGLLCQAAGELTLAARERPDEARPHWYLSQVWARLGQSQPAAACLRRAKDAAPFADLTPGERRDLAQSASR
jgi:hypothetical protein